MHKMGIRMQENCSIITYPSSILSRSMSLRIFLNWSSHTSLVSRNCLWSSVRSVSSKRLRVNVIPYNGFFISCRMYASSFNLAIATFSVACCTWRACRSRHKTHVNCQTVTTITYVDYSHFLHFLLNVPGGDKGWSPENNTCCSSRLAMCKKQKMPVTSPSALQRLLVVTRASMSFPSWFEKEMGNLSASWPSMVLFRTIMNFVMSSWLFSRQHITCTPKISPTSIFPRTCRHRHDNIIKNWYHFRQGTTLSRFYPNAHNNCGTVQT